MKRALLIFATAFTCSIAPALVSKYDMVLPAPHQGDDMLCLIHQGDGMLCLTHQGEGVFYSIPHQGEGVF